MNEQNYVQMNSFFQDWQSFNKIWKDFSQFSHFISFSQHLLTKHIVSKISWYFLIWGTCLKLYNGMSGPSFETSFAYDVFSQQVLTKWYEVWKLRKVLSYFVETLSVLKEAIHLNIILFNHYLLHFCT